MRSDRWSDGRASARGVATGNQLSRRTFVGGCAACQLTGAAFAQPRPGSPDFGCSIAPSSYARLRIYSDQEASGLTRGLEWKGASIGPPPQATGGGNLKPEFYTALGEVLAGLSKIYGQTPSFAFYDDGTNLNAQASSMTSREVPGTDGSVVFGINMMARLLPMDSGDMAIFAVCAHEFGHIYQFHSEWSSRIGSTLPKYCLELHADYMAGFCLGHYLLAYPDVDIRPVGPIWQSLGSTDFTNPTFHGTPRQRLAAIEAGYALVGRQKTVKVAAAAKQGYDHVARAAQNAGQ